MICDCCHFAMSEDETGYLHIPSQKGGHIACMRVFIAGWSASLAHLAKETLRFEDELEH